MSRRDHGQTDGDGQTVIFLTPTHPHQSLVEYCNPFHTKTYSEHTASQPSPFPLATHYHKSPFGLSPGIPPSVRLGPDCRQNRLCTDLLLVIFLHDIELKISLADQFLRVRQQVRQILRKHSRAHL